LAGAGATSGVALAHYELHAWCLLVLAWVFVPFYMRSMVFTMPEFLERRFSPASRYVLSIVSIITFIVSKIAVGIFAGGVVFGTLLPELHITIGNTNIDSFWIGSVLVIALTGLYTALGGMRAVAYNDAVQTFVLILGSFSLTAYGLVKLGGWHELRYWCGSDMFNLWKPLIPPGVQGTWAPVLQTDAAGNIVKEAWYFNGYFPWIGRFVGGHYGVFWRGYQCLPLLFPPLTGWGGGGGMLRNISFPRWPNGNSRNGAGRTGLDSGDQGRVRPVYVFAGCAGISRA